MKQVFEALTAIEDHLEGLFEAADSADAILEREDVDFVREKLVVCREGILLANGDQGQPHDPNEPVPEEETAMSPHEIAEQLEGLAEELRSYEFQEDDGSGGGTSS